LSFAALVLGGPNQYADVEVNPSRLLAFLTIRYQNQHVVPTIVELSRSEQDMFEHLGALGLVMNAIEADG